MIEVIVRDLRPDRIIDIVRGLRQQGLVQGKDFDFEYRHAEWDDHNGFRHTVFKFYNEKHGLFFSLKYSS